LVLVAVAKISDVADGHGVTMIVLVGVPTWGISPKKDPTLAHALKIIASKPNIRMNLSFCISLLILLTLAKDEWLY
jgi:hypothetical protein